MIKSIKIGDIAENEASEYLMSIGCATSKNTNVTTRIEYDILASKDEISIKLEVKNDVMASKTGNVAIEYFNSKKQSPSGITATKADWWIHKINDVLWVVRCSELLAFTKRAKPARIVMGGGDNNADLLLYKIEDFVEICTPLSEMTWDKLIE